jgi:hypothetical protein
MHVVDGRREPTVAHQFTTSRPRPLRPINAPSSLTVVRAGAEYHREWASRDVVPSCLVQFSSQLQFINKAASRDHMGLLSRGLSLTDSAVNNWKKEKDKTDDKLTIHELAGILRIAWTTGLWLLLHAGRCVVKIKCHACRSAWTHRGRKSGALQICSNLLHASLILRSAPRLKIATWSRDRLNDAQSEGWIIYKATTSRGSPTFMQLCLINLLIPC